MSELYVGQSEYVSEQRLCLKKLYAKMVASEIFLHVQRMTRAKECQQKPEFILKFSFFNFVLVKR